MTITHVARIEARFEEYAWPWAQANAVAISQFWAGEVKRKPKLFNGIVLLAKDVRITGDTLFASSFPCALPRSSRSRCSVIPIRRS